MRGVCADDNLRMDVQSLKRKFGIERYNAACKEARARAQRRIGSQMFICFTGAHKKED